MADNFDEILARLNRALDSMLDPRMFPHEHLVVEGPRAYYETADQRYERLAKSSSNLAGDADG